MADLTFSSGIFQGMKAKDMGDGTFALVVSTAAASSASDADDTNLSETDVVTNATPGVWSELFPANAARKGASVQAVFATGNVFFKQLDAALPANGKQNGETQLPVAPAYFRFDFNPKKRYVVRGDTASLRISVKTW